MAGIIQRLMQATGKSSDEILELLGKKAATTGDDISEQAALANLRKEASDAAVPMGSGKNLEALQQAETGIAESGAAKLDELQKGAGNAPFIDSERNVNAQDLGLSFGDAPAKKYPMPDNSGIKASKAAAPSLATSADELAGSVPLEEKKKMSLKQIAAMMGLTMGGGAMMMGGDEQPPMTPQQLAKQSTPTAAPVPDKGMESSIASTIKASMTGQGAAPTEQAPSESEPDLAPIENKRNFEQEVIAGQRASGENTMYANLARAAQQAGAGIGSLGAGSQVKNDYSGIDSLIASAGQPSKDVTARHGAMKEQQSYDKAQDEINDEKALSDPNSNISKTTVAQLAKYGINVKTAKEAKQMNPQIFNLLLQDRAAANAKETAKMTLEASSNKQSKTLDEKQRKFAQGLRKEATTGVLGKQYATYSTGQRMQSSLEQFAANPSGYKDYATLMGGLKSLQGDESVVREAEVRLGINATSAINKAMNYLQSATNGKQLQPEQRKEMIDTIKILTEASRSQYMQSVAPILEQAEMEGIDPNIILSGSLSGAKAEAKSPESDKLTTEPVTGTVKVRRISDGITKEVPAASAAKMDKSKYEIIH